MRAEARAVSCCEECGIVDGDALFIRENGESIWKIHDRTDSAMEVVRFSIPVQRATFIHRRVNEEIGRPDRRLNYGHDSKDWIPASRVAPFWHEGKFLVTVRFHEVSEAVGSHRGSCEEWIRGTKALLTQP